MSNVISQILKDLPINEAKYKEGVLSATEYEKYLLQCIDYMGEISPIVDSDALSLLKEYTWAKLEFKTSKHDKE